MDYPYHGKSIIALVNQIFIIITSLSKLSTPNPQHHMFDNTLVMVKIILMLIWDLKILKICQTTKKKSLEIVLLGASTN